MTARGARPLAALILTAAAFAARPLRATDFYVLEIGGSYEWHADGGDHGSYGLGFTWDTFVTAKALRGVELGARADLLHCRACDHALDGTQVLASVLLTPFRAEDISPVTPYLGVAGGGGYSRQGEQAFGVFELQLATQIRATYAGLWIRPVVFGATGGAYDGYYSAGLRLVLGYAVNHGEAQPSGSFEPLGPCDVPRAARLAAAEQIWVLPGCSAANVDARVDGRSVQATERDGKLEVTVGSVPSPRTQEIEIDFGSGRFFTQLTRD